MKTSLSSTTPSSASASPYSAIGPPPSPATDPFSDLISSKATDPLSDLISSKSLSDLVSLKSSGSVRALITPHELAGVPGAMPGGIRGSSVRRDSSIGGKPSTAPGGVMGGVEEYRGNF